MKTRRLRLEEFETRINPVTIRDGDLLNEVKGIDENFNFIYFTVEDFGAAILKDADSIPATVMIFFSNADPGTPLGTVPVGGITLLEELEAVDVRPTDGILYGLIVGGTVGRVVTVDPVTGDTTPVGSSFTVSGSDFGFDFNPVTGLAHIVSDADEHFTFDPATGSTADLPALASSTMVAAAFTNGPDGTTEMYGIDTGGNVVSHIDPATGTPTPVNSLGFNPTGAIGFDVAEDNAGYVSVQFDGAPSRLYQAFSSNRAPHLLGTFPDGAEVIDFSFLGSVAVPKAGKAVFTEADGDRVTVTASRGRLSAATLGLRAATGGGFTVGTIDLSDPQYAGANVKITAKKGPDGDGFVDVGAILAGDNNLGAVTVDGDLGRIVAGNPANSATTPGVKSLTVQTMGKQGGDLASQVAGALPKLIVKDDFDRASVAVTGNLGTLKIGNLMVGGPADDSGSITAAAIKGVTVAGSIFGGDGERSGRIVSLGDIGSLTIVGDLFAGAGDLSGSISAEGAIGKMLVKGSIVGRADQAARVLAAGSPGDEKPAIGKLTVKGKVENAQVLAGYGSDGVFLNNLASIGTVSVGTDWIASDLVAGATAGVNGRFGDGDDLAEGESSIKSIVIKGDARGTAGGTDHFGFVARTVKSMKVAGVKLPLTDTDDDLAVGSTGDLRVSEPGA